MGARRMGRAGRTGARPAGAPTRANCTGCSQTIKVAVVISYTSKLFVAANLSRKIAMVRNFLCTKTVFPLIKCGNLGNLERELQLSEQILAKEKYCGEKK
ncbi:MAG: hypothetical protein ACREEK_17290 [Bradyrhizobium sp.]